MSIDPQAVASYVTGHPTAAGLALVAALIVLVIVWRAGLGITHAVRRGLRGKRPEDVITFIYSAMATAVSAEGVLNFFKVYLEMPTWMQAMTFCMFELGMLGCALRARRKIRDPEIGAAGIDGKLVWIIAATSGLLASTAASGWGVLARIIIPLFAAGGWELLLAYERRRAGRSKISWRWTPEKILVRLGLAEPAHRSVGEVDTHRRLNVAAVATYRMDLLRSSKWAWRITRAQRRQNSAMQDLMATTDFATNAAMQDELRTMVAVLKGAATLADLSDAPPWARPDPVVAVFDTARIQFAPLIAGAISTGTEKPAELGIGTGTEDPSGEPTDTGTKEPSGTGTEDAPEAGTDTGTEPPRKPGTQRRRSTGTRTSTRTGRGTDWDALLKRARELNEKHFQEHGRPISGDKLAAGIHVSKPKALQLLAEVKRLREVRSEDGAA